MVLIPEVPVYSPTTNSQPTTAVALKLPATVETPAILLEPSSPHGVADAVAELQTTEPDAEEFISTATVDKENTSWSLSGDTSIAIRLIVKVKKTREHTETQQIDFDIDISENVSEVVAELINEFKFPVTVSDELITQINSFIEESGLSRK